MEGKLGGQIRLDIEEGGVFKSDEREGIFMCLYLCLL